MKVIEHTIFNEEYPENYTWGRIDKISYSNLANTISNHINHELRNRLPEDRILVPGLRKALLLIAERADI
uniref:Uncharacterized protein n=1 Tax=viral metagenome TaxID=1070528 RepID=A0A6M3LG39_9ZZZZ